MAGGRVLGSRTTGMVEQDANRGDFAPGRNHRGEVGGGDTLERAEQEQPILIVQEQAVTAFGEFFRRRGVVRTVHRTRSFAEVGLLANLLFPY